MPGRGGKRRAALLMVLGLWLSAQVQAAISVVGSGVAGNSASSPVSSLTVSNPGAQAGDVLLVQLVLAEPQFVSAPGWTSALYDTQTFSQQVFYRVAGAGEPSSYTFSFASTRAAAGVLLIRGASVASGNPISASQSERGNGTTLTALSATANSAGSLVLRYFALANGNSQPSGPATQQYAVATRAGGNGVALSASSALQASAGQTGNAQASNAVGADWLSLTLVLAPAATPLLSWWMNESVWNGAANEVLDSSGNALHGRAYNGARTDNASPALAVDGNGFGTCRYGALASASRQYLQTADSPLLDLTGSFTIGIWVSPVSRPGELMSILSKDENYELHLKPSGVVNWWWTTTAGTVRELDSTLAVPLNAWTHVAIRFSPGAQRIFINGTPAGSASFSGVPLSNGDPLQLGQDQGVAGRYFNGALDELRIYNQALSDAEILALSQERPAVCATAPDHYELLYASSQGLTCNALDVIVRACQNSTCSSLYASPVTLNLTPSGTPNNWSLTPLSFTGSTAVQFQRTTAGSVILGLAGTPAASNATRCIVGGVAGSCAVSFASSGFILDVPNMLANKPTAATLQAVKDDGTQTCVPAWQGERTVNFTRTYSNPASGTLQVQINGSTVTSNTPLTLNFDSTASAALTVRYADAGLITLNANYTGSSGLDAGLVLSGSDEFVSKPYGLHLETDTAASCTQADISCPLYPGGVRAGDPFSLRIRAVAWQSDGEPLTAAALADNLSTPNFQLAGIALSGQLQAPAGGSAGTLSATSYSHALGNQTTLSQSVSEVGVFRLTATPGTGAYFTETVSAGQSDLVGRFAPAYLQAAGDALLSPACNGVFSYQGQPMAFSGGRQPQLSVTAYNRQGGVTGNYDRGAFWRLAEPAREAYQSVTGRASLDAAGRLRVQGAVSASQSGADGGDGARTWRWSGEQLLYAPATVPLADDLPFSAAIRQDFSAAALTDADGACVGGGSTCQRYSYDFSGSQVRLGRLSIGNAHGSELQPLSLPLRLESWQGSGTGLFQLEGADTCTASVLGQPQLGTTTGNLGAGDTTASLSLPSLTAAQGLISLSAPGAGNDGSVQVGLSTPPACVAGQANCLPDWLWFDWRGAGREAPQGLATFGVYRGAAPLIFRRELYR